MSCMKNACFIGVCLCALRKIIQDRNTIYEVDTLFSFEKANKAFEKYCRTPTTKNSESSNTFLAVFEAVITEAEDTFGRVLHDKSDVETYVGEKTQTVFQ